MKKLLTKGDIIEICKPLYVGDNPVQTKCGSFLTLVAAVLTIVVSLNVGKELWEKKRPQVIIENKYMKNSPALDLNFDKFNLALSITFGNGSLIPNIERYLSITASHRKVIGNQAGGYIANSSYFKVSKCNTKPLKIITDDPTQINSLAKDNYYCIQSPFNPISGSLSSDDALSTLNFWIGKCETSSGIQCANNSEINALIGEYISVALLYNDITIEYKNYKNPIVKRLDQYFRPLSSDRLTIVEMNFKKITMNSHVGLITSQIQTEEMIKYEKKELETIKTSGNTLLGFMIYSSSNTEIIER